MGKEFILRELARYSVGTYADIINRNGLLYPEKIALKCGLEQASFSQFSARVNRLIHALRSLDVRKGEVLGILELPGVHGCVRRGDEGRLHRLAI